MDFPHPGIRIAVLALGALVVLGGVIWIPIFAEASAASVWSGAAILVVEGLIAVLSALSLFNRRSPLKGPRIRWGLIGLAVVGLIGSVILVVNGAPGGLALVAVSSGVIAITAQLAFPYKSASDE